MGAPQDAHRVAAGKDKLEAADAERARAALDELPQASDAVTKALRTWQQLVAPDCKAPRIANTVNATRDSAAAIAKILEALGVNTLPATEKLRQINE